MTRAPRFAAALAFSMTLALGAATPSQELDKVVSLFNGKDLKGWKPVNTKDNFVVKDGVLVMDRGSGWLATEKTYKDFELTLVYRFVTPGADSGVFIRSGLEGKNWTSRGYQIQNMDNETIGRVVSMGKPVEGNLHTAQLAKSARHKSGQWNQLVILARGEDVVVTLNGTPIASARIDREAGHIGLQAEGGVLEFREIQLRDYNAQ